MLGATGSHSRSTCVLVLQASQLKDVDVAAAAQAAPVRSTGATVAAADSFHAVRPPGFEIKARLAGIQVMLWAIAQLDTTGHTTYLETSAWMLDICSELSSDLCACASMSI